MKRALGLVCIAVGTLMLLVGSMGAAFLMVNAQQGDREIAIVMGGVAIVGLVFLILAVILTRGSKSSLPIVPPVGLREGNFLVNVPETIERNGHPVEVHYLGEIRGKNGRPSSLKVGIPAKTPTTLHFQPERWFDRLSKMVGLAHEHQTGDPEFDRALYVRSPSDGYADLVLADADRRAAIRALLQLGYSEIQMTGTQVVAIWPSFKPEKSDHPELVPATADLLLLIGKNLPDEDPDHVAERPDRRKFALICLWIFMVLYAATLLLLGECVPLHFVELLKIAVPVFLGGYVVFGLAAALLIGGTSISHDRWGTLMSFGIVFHALGSVGATGLYNGFGDTAPLVERELTIVSKRSHTSTGKSRRTTYYASVPSWEPGGGTLEFKVSVADYNRIQQNRSKMHLVTGPGQLGIEWIRSQRIIP